MTIKDIQEWHVSGSARATTKQNNEWHWARRALRPMLLALLAIAAILTWAANASGADGSDRTLSPYFHVQTADGDTETFPLKSTTVDVSISGIIADVTVKQLYANMGNAPIDAVYVFPASTRSAVHGMTMRIGDRVIDAQVRERAEAREEYEQAKREHKTVALLEQQRPNVFEMRIGRVLAGDEVEIELRYTEHLLPENSIYEFVYPTVVGPRYSNLRESEAQSTEKWIANPYLKEGTPAPARYDISVSVNGGMPLESVACDSHTVKIDYSDATSAMVGLDPTETNTGNRDFILRYQLAGEEVASGLILHESADEDGENFFLLTVQPPERVTSDDISKREYLFVVDVSGSMSGFPLDTAKTLMRSLLGELRPGDYFNVLLFAGGSEVLARRSMEVSQGNLRRAHAFLDSRSGGGGTELLPALNRALALPKAEGYSRSVIIVTDGFVRVERETFDTLRNNLGDANAFAFGIGSSVNRFLIEGIARAGGGESFVVTRPAEATKMAERLRDYVAAPVLTDIEINYDGFDAYDVEPPAYPDVMSERPLVVWGKWRGAPDGSIEVTGLRGDDTRFRHLHAVDETTSASKESALPYLWARQRIAALSDYIGIDRTDEDVREVTTLGLSHNLLTEYTSFIAVDTEARKTEDSAVSTVVKQPLPLPAGVGNAAVPEPQMILLALIAAMSLLWSRGRRRS